jgi:hypothetical protein
MSGCWNLQLTFMNKSGAAREQMKACQFMPGAIITLAVMLSFATCAAEAQRRQVKMSNTYYHVDERFFWKVFVDEAPNVLQSIQCVDYALYPTLPDPSRHLCDGTNGFAAQERSQSEFPIAIKIAWRNGDITFQSYMLDLHSPDAALGCLNETVKVHEVVPFGVPGPMSVYLANLPIVPLEFHGQADIFVLGSGSLSGPRRQIQSNDFRHQIANFDKQSYVEKKIFSHYFAPVVVSQRSYTVVVDTSYQQGSAKVWLCPAK